MLTHSAFGSDARGLITGGAHLLEFCPDTTGFPTVGQPGQSHPGQSQAKARYRPDQG